MIYEYANLPRSLYERVKGIPLDLTNLLFDEYPNPSKNLMSKSEKSELEKS